MPKEQIIFMLVVFAVLLAWVISLILRNHLRETYAVIWILVILCIPASILLFPLVLRVSGLFGFISPANFSFVVSIVVLFLISLHFSVLNSRMQRTLKNTVQKLAILEEEITHLKGR